MRSIHLSQRTGQCPNRCRIGLVALLDTQLQLAKHQRSGLPLQRLACLLAVFVPFETATRLLEELIGISVSPRSVWYWVQNTGQKSTRHIRTREADSSRPDLPNHRTIPDAYWCRWGDGSFSSAKRNSQGNDSMARDQSDYCDPIQTSPSSKSERPQPNTD